MDPLFQSKTDFILLLGRALHGCGAAAHHLERAFTKASHTLGLSCECLAFPTGIMARFVKDAQERTVVIRNEPGHVDLSKLSRIDEAADQVIAGSLDLAAGTRLIEAIHQAPPEIPKLLSIFSYGVTSAGLIATLGGSWLDLGVAFAVGSVVGCLDILGLYWQPMRQIFGALASFLTVLMVMLLAKIWPGLAMDKVILAGIIVLLPGLTLVVSFVELSTKNLLSGTARLAGATGELFKIVFTVALTQRLLMVPDLGFSETTLPQIPAWAEIPGVLSLAIGFLFIFRVRPRDMLAALCVSVSAYSLARFGKNYFGHELSFFVAGAFVAMVSNLLAKILHRPGLITLLPGIILIVPGSINYSGFIAMFNNDVFDCVATVSHGVIVVVSIVAGMFFGNTLVPPRRSL